MASLNAMALGSMIFTAWYMSFESRKANKFEVFNDGTTLVITYHLWCFTDFLDEPETRSLLGWSLIGVLVANIATHLVSMIVSQYYIAKVSCRRRKARKQAQRAAKERRQSGDKSPTVITLQLSQAGQRLWLDRIEELSLESEEAKVESYRNPQHQGRDAMRKNEILGGKSRRQKLRVNNIFDSR